MHVPLAFSIHHFVSSVGADAGFAAIVGLAILVLLYFAQARETSTLRDESVAASQRVAELERRLAQLSPGRVAPAPRPEGVPAAKPPPLPIPAAPAGVGAPALFSATRLIPEPSGAAAPAVALRPPEVAPQVSAPVAATPRPATAAAIAQTPAPVAEVPGAPRGDAVPAAAPAPATNGTGEHHIAAPATNPLVTSSGAKPGAAETAPGGSARPLAAQIRPAAAFRAPVAPVARTARRGSARRFLPIALIALIALAAIAALLIVTSTGGSSRPIAGTKTTNAPAARSAAGAAFRPASVTVAVLNGTDVFQLAHRVAQRLHGAGYRDGAVATAADQTHTSTLVGYLPGHKQAAVKITDALKLPASAIQPADPSAKAVACPPPSACRADVIITVGTDLSRTP